MIIVAIIGKSGSSKYEIESIFEKAGFNRIISYTTRDIKIGEEQGKNYHFITEEQFDKLIERDILVEYTTYNNKRYGAPKPVGFEKYVIVVETTGYEKLKQLYSNQVYGVYVETSENKSEQSNNIFENSRKISDITVRDCDLPIVNTSKVISSLHSKNIL